MIALPYYVLAALGAALARIAAAPTRALRASRTSVGDAGGCIETAPCAA